MSERNGGTPTSGEAPVIFERCPVESYADSSIETVPGINIPRMLIETALAFPQAPPSTWLNRLWRRSEGRGTVETARSRGS